MPERGEGAIEEGQEFVRSGFESLKRFEHKQRQGGSA